MDGFISSGQKQNIKNIVDKIHSTFARQIIVYKDGKIPSTSTDASYNSFYKRGSTKKLALAQNSKQITARIQYKKLESHQFYQGSTSEKANIEEGEIFIIVNAEDYLFVRDAKVAEIDGRNYGILGPGLATGMFGPQYYKFQVTPLEV
jgi:hypothetical protein